MKILFLCHGNICRSPMAEFVMKDLVRKAGVEGVEIESAALHTDEIGNDIHYGTRGKLREMGVPFTPRAAWLITAAKAKEYDLLIGMDAYNIADCGGSFIRRICRRYINYPSSLVGRRILPIRGTLEISIQLTMTSSRAARRYWRVLRNDERRCIRSSCQEQVP